MTDTPERTSSQWNTSPAAKTKNAVERSVTALLDELAPEKVLTRAAQLPGTIDQHRTPTGCVLQGEDYALSVSWFPGTSSASDLGELNVVVWRGTVARRGARRPAANATVLAEMRLVPIDPPTEDAIWRADDGGTFDTATLAARCLALLEEQVSGAR